MLIRSVIAARMFGTSEVLIAAKKLIGCPGVTQDHDTGRIVYAHFMCDRHEIVFANGAPAETLFPGREAQNVIDSQLGCAPLPAIDPTPARAFAPGRRALHMAARHTRNCKPLLEMRHM